MKAYKVKFYSEETYEIEVPDYCGEDDSVEVAEKIFDADKYHFTAIDIDVERVDD